MRLLYLKVIILFQSFFHHRLKTNGAFSSILAILHRKQKTTVKSIKYFFRAQLSKRKHIFIWHRVLLSHCIVLCYCLLSACCYFISLFVSHYLLSIFLYTHFSVLYFIGNVKERNIKKKTFFSYSILGGEKRTLKIVV